MASDGRREGAASFQGFSLSVTVPDEAEADLSSPLSLKVRWAGRGTFWSPRFGVGWIVSGSTVLSMAPMQPCERTFFEWRKRPRIRSSIKDDCLDACERR
jgi:hypothetical protein